MTSIANVPNFLAYFGSSVLLLCAFLATYTLITPIREWQLIREGNVAAALSLVGAMIGFCLPLATAVIHSANFVDMVVWAAIALGLQLLCFAAMYALRRDAGAAIARGDVAEATLSAGVSVALGILNAACVA